MNNTQERVCPLCGQKYTSYPAISRLDNKTEICSDCGVWEAFVDFARIEKLKKECD